jgi:hypothetical protein
MRGGAGAPPADPTGGSPAVGSAALWFGLFGGPAFWSLQLIATYAVAAHACFPRRQPLVASSAPGARLAVCLIIVVALAGAVTALLTAMSSGRALRGGPGGLGAGLDAALGRARFMAHSGIMLSVVFTGAVVLSALALLLTPVCW